MSEGLKLWLISQDANDGYDTYDSAVVVAATEKEARHISPDGFRVWMTDRWHLQLSDGTTGPEARYDTWADPGQVKVELVGIAAPHLKSGDKVCASFNAG